MSGEEQVGCSRFDELVDDLALGFVDEPERGRLLRHAAACPRCQSAMEGLGLVADRLLLLAPELEPPADFEARALARIGVPHPSRRPRVAWLVAAALVLVAGGLGLGVAATAGRSSSIVSAPVRTEDGRRVGSIELVAEPRPHVLLVVDPSPARPSSASKPPPGERYCELRRPDGTWVKVGSWERQDVVGGMWAAGIDASLLDSVAMRITTEDGTRLAEADFS